MWMTLRRCLVATGASLLAVPLATALPSATAVAAPASATAVLDVQVPAGGRLRQLPSGEVLVEDGRGEAIGAYDAPWASDTLGRRLPTVYRVDGDRLVQTVRFAGSARTGRAVMVQPIYSPIGSGGRPAASADLAVTSVAARPALVTVPTYYVYDPSLGVLHDYCTSAPDEFPAPGAPNADFRGPCARHDLCYAGSTAEQTCDARLLADMRQNCAHYYAPHSVLRATCRATARVYWVAVVIAT